jgi:hypothetical protein
LLRLVIPVSGSAHGPFRAVLKLLPREKEIMSEIVVVETAVLGTPRVIFTVPAPLLSDDEEYFVELNTTRSADAISDAHIFAFHVMKRGQ